MGEVYLATRDDQKYRKDVAIKVVRAGLESELILRRFRHERQIPRTSSIRTSPVCSTAARRQRDCRIFVMEYVEGLPIDAYSDTRRLSIRERLMLFRTVCSAVEHAHEHQVVHRDIKPTNILVNAEGVPKLLDFGIAKLLTSDGTQSETVTTAGMLTPEFASPEQMRGESVNESTDIYALGVLLYRLLTGRSPYRVTSERPHELARAICEDEPVRPSTAVGTGERARRPHAHGCRHPKESARHAASRSTRCGGN